MSWLNISILTVLLWGIWGFLAKVSTKYINQPSAQAFSFLGGMLSMLIAFKFIGQPIQTNPRGVAAAFADGFFGALGTLCFYFALSRGAGSLTVSITALYPIVTLILAYFFLGEVITLKQGIGILFAVLSIYLIS